MKVSIKKACFENLEACKIALVNSELGSQYFPVEENAIITLKQGIENEEIFIAYNDNENCLGFLWFIPKGAFHSYPYLHIIAVKEEFRGMGIGRQLLSFFEDLVFTSCSKIFLVVADFNPKAKLIYENLGYINVGAIPGLYKKGVTEYLMMKEMA